MKISGRAARKGLVKFLKSFWVTWPLFAGVSFGSVPLFLMILMRNVPTSEDLMRLAAPQDIPYVKIDVSEQRLYLYDQGKLVMKYPVSTSKFGIGNRVGSNQTPLGRHRIVAMIGGNARLNTVFKSRKNTGRTTPVNLTRKAVYEDLITTRILWLEGLEIGVNHGKGVDSFKRGIYVHGTADEGLIGTPASHGCIRMKNADVADFFERVRNGTYVDIQK